MLLRSEAQMQARTLHQCFDVMPMSCQKRGYVGVKLSLSRTGEIREHSIAGSSYGADCPVNQCLSNVVGSWFFEPLPQSMSLMLARCRSCAPTSRCRTAPRARPRTPSARRRVAPPPRVD